MDERQKKLLAIGGGIGCVLICCFIAVLVFAIIDPFGWIERIFGGGDPLAKSMPENTDMYISVDIGRLLSDDAEAVVGSFIDSIPEAGVEDLESAMDDIVDSIFYGYDLTFSEDIQPWVGQYLSFAAIDMESIAYGDPSENMIVALDVRNRDAADEFIQDYIEISEQVNDARYESFDYRGVTIYEDRFGFSTEALARSGKVLLFSPSAVSIQDAIDAQKGESLADDPEFKRITSQMPSNRFLTIYIGEGLLTSFDDIFMGMGVTSDLTSTYTRSLAFTLAFEDFGIQFDTFMGIDEAEMEDTQRDLMESMQAQGDLISMLPEDTLGFFIGRGFDQLWESFADSMDEVYGGDFEDSMRFFEDDFGFRPDLDLFPILDGEWSIAVVPSSDSVFLGEDVGLGILLIAESSQENDLRDVVEDARTALERQGMDVIERSADGGTIYTIEDSGIQMLSMGIQDDVLMIGTDAIIMQDMMEGSSSIEDDRNFLEVWEAFPRNTIPIVYVNLYSVMDSYRMSMDASWDDMIWDIGFDPRVFTHLALGSGGINDGVIRATIIVFMEMD